jgi:transcriptional regulator with XRE-family HTH domain
MIHDRRSALGLTLAELAERARMRQPQLSRLESGGAVPTLPLLAKLAAALEADLEISFKPPTSVAAQTAERRGIGRRDSNSQWEGDRDAGSGLTTHPRPITAGEFLYESPDARLRSSYANISRSLDGTGASVSTGRRRSRGGTGGYLWQ